MTNAPMLLDRYRILDVAGEGGFGTVEHAYDTRLRRDVAIKCIPLSEADRAKAHLAALEEALAPEPELAERAGEAIDLPGLDEARAAAQLSDPHIVTVYDFEIHDDVAYIIMEYIEGRTLTELLEDLGDDVTLDEVAAVFDAVSAALVKAHQAGVLHLDVKPDNVLIDDNGTIKVTDFGLASLMDAGGTGTTGGGTVGYMPLEQMRREPLDERSDEWALGALTYTMLTGHNPFEVKGGLAAAQQAIEQTVLDAPSRYWEPLGPEFDAVIERALAPDINDRYPSVKAFAQALKGFLGAPRRGREQIGAFITEGLPEEVVGSDFETPAQPLVDRIGEAGAALILRGVAVLGVLVITATALINVPSSVLQWFGGLGGQATANIAPAADAGWSMGLASAYPWLFWVLLALMGLLAAFRPTVGVGVAWVLFSLVWLCAGQWWLGGGLLAIVLLWWWAVGRHGPAEAMVGALEPLAGSVGFGALAPIAAGTLCTPGRALATAAFNVVGALVYAGFGSGDLMGWNIFLNLTAPSSSVATAVETFAQRPAIWCVAASWLLAAIVFSLFSARNSRRMAIAGAFIAAALLIAGVCVGTWFSTYGTSALPSVFSFIGALFPGILGIIFAILGVTIKARTPLEGDNS